jgi:mannose-6-phosphate isomerase-like protein (cupin superfamily)
LSRNFGATPEKIERLSFTSDDPRHREMASYIVRFSQQKPQWQVAGFGRLPYIGEGGATPGTFSKDLIVLPVGKGVRAYERNVEEAYLVLEGCLTVTWEENGRSCEQRLGPRDLILNPPGTRRAFRNDGFETTQCMMVVGSPKPDVVDFRAA